MIKNYSINNLFRHITIVLYIYVLYKYRYYFGFTITCSIAISWIYFILVFIRYNMCGSDIFLVMKRPVISKQPIDLIYNYLTIYIYNIQCVPALFDNKYFLLNYLIYKCLIYSCQIKLEHTVIYNI